MIITLDIDNATLKEIEGTYGNSAPETVEAIANNIMDRYLNIQYFDPNLPIE